MKTTLFRETALKKYSNKNIGKIFPFSPNRDIRFSVALVIISIIVIMAL